MMGVDPDLELDRVGAKRPQRRTDDLTQLRAEFGQRDLRLVGARVLRGRDPVQHRRADYVSVLRGSEQLRLVERVRALQVLQQRPKAYPHFARKLRDVSLDP